MQRPDHTEAAEYYFTYIDQVGDGHIVEILMKQGAEMRTMLSGIPEEQSLRRYAPDKWTIRETLAHLNDTERVFVSRAFWFARGFDTPLPSFDQNIANTGARANDRNWRSHVEEFQTVRSATISLFDNLPDEAWGRRGVASGNPFTVLALAYMCAGHATHHLKILHERYLQGAGA